MATILHMRSSLLPKRPNNFSKNVCGHCVIAFPSLSLTSFTALISMCHFNWNNTHYAKQTYHSNYNEAYSKHTHTYTHTHTYQDTQTQTKRKTQYTNKLHEIMHSFLTHQCAYFPKICDKRCVCLLLTSINNYSTMCRHYFSAAARFVHWQNSSVSKAPILLLIYKARENINQPFE